MQIVRSSFLTDFYNCFISRMRVGYNSLQHLFCMKKICCQESGLIILACLLFSLLSCNAYYFSRPQPVDRKNIYRFPKSFRGTWISGVPAMDTGKSIIVTFVYDSAGQPVTKDEKKSSFKEEESLDLDAGHYLVGHNYFLKVNCSKVRIQKGAWPKINQ